ncbi:MAG: AMP-binding protein, partial [Cytophagales bacterium]|nr:AMP-binding protein [Cytophagales bacterium]
MNIPEIEIQSPAEIKRFQENKLREQLIYLQENSPFYQDLFQKNNIHIGKIQQLEDLQLLPTTLKDDLQQRNFDFLCVDKTQIIDYVTTSGTLGEPVTFALTEKDLERLAHNEFLGLACADGTHEDIYQLTTTMDKRFMAGLAYFMGARKLGAGIVRVGPGIPELQWDTIFRIKPTTLVAVPSFILKLIEYAEKSGIDIRSSSIKKAVCIGEPLRNPDFSLNTLGKKIKEKWDIGLYSTYASTEMSTAFTECKHGIGGHLHPELIIVELLDDAGNPVKPGEAGEVTVTSLGVEAMPLLRFRTGDICQLFDEPCRCGRNTPRLGPVIGRKKHMIKYKGTTLFPPAINDTLNAIDGIDAYLVEVYTDS